MCARRSIPKNCCRQLPNSPNNDEERELMLPKSFVALRHKRPRLVV